MASRPAKSNLGRRSLKPPILTTPNSQQRSRLGLRRINVPSLEKKTVKKQLFKNIGGQENQNPPYLGKSLTSNVRSTGGTPVQVNITKAVDSERGDKQFYFGDSRMFTGCDNTPNRKTLYPPSYNGRPGNLKELPSSFLNSLQSDSFPDLESREQNLSFNAWSVFKKPHPVKQKLPETFKENGKASATVFHSSPNSEYEQEKADSIFHADNISQIELPAPTTEAEKPSVHLPGQSSEISFFPKYNIRTGIAIKTPSPPLSAIKAFKNEKGKLNLPEEPEPPPELNNLNNPLLRYSNRSQRPVDYTDNYFGSHQRTRTQKSCRYNLCSPSNNLHGSTDSFILAEATILGNEFDFNRKKCLSRISEEPSSLSHLNTNEETRQEKEPSSRIIPEAHCVPEPLNSGISELFNLFKIIQTNHEKIEQNLILEGKFRHETEKYVDKIKENLDSQKKLRMQTEDFAKKVKEDFLKLQIKMNDIFSEIYPSEISLLSRNLEGALSLKVKSTVDSPDSEKEVANGAATLSTNTSPNARTQVGSQGKPCKAEAEAAKAFTELKASCSTLKTPVRQSRNQSVRKSCYTPGSLSVCIQDQVKDIFGSEI